MLKLLSQLRDTTNAGKTPLLSCADVYHIVSYSQTGRWSLPKSIVFANQAVFALSKGGAVAVTLPPSSCAVEGGVDLPLPP